MAERPGDDALASVMDEAVTALCQLQHTGQIFCL